MSFELRDYQRKAIDNIDAAFARGALGAFLVLPTGGGKTVNAHLSYGQSKRYQVECYRQ